jgi:hypothetical protein
MSIKTLWKRIGKKCKAIHDTYDYWVYCDGQEISWGDKKKPWVPAPLRFMYESVFYSGWLSALVCRWRGHKWKTDREYYPGYGLMVTHYCTRCEEIECQNMFEE